ncbi:MAG: molybdenum cofactor biosynthesis protein MoaE [Gammaproteobacteria bacterium]|nr:molybdenum cofactor biosynthesis protein MoaE [Gammaproteobacteria bacterium]
MARFAFARAAINPATLSRTLAEEACGALVTFEGWVRNHNDGRPVLRLDYEGYEALAVREGSRIIDEAIARFGVSGAACVHRLGSLALGDLAVWVGVTSGHRGAAFDACRYIIDEVKSRVPIWKKEYYEGGDSGWINCDTR